MADNCVAQNKNWLLFAALFQYVNCQNRINRIEIRYLEKGHTFMRADAIHGLISRHLRRIQMIGTFSELVKGIGESKPNLQCLELTPDKIRRFSAIPHGDYIGPKLRSLKAVYPRQCIPAMQAKIGSSLIHTNTIEWHVTWTHIALSSWETKGDSPVQERRDNQGTSSRHADALQTILALAPYLQSRPGRLTC